MQIKINSINFTRQRIIKPENKTTEKQLEISDVKTEIKQNHCFLSPICPVKKTQEINKLKNKLIKVYDLIYEDMANEAKEKGINFVKPKLIFKPLDKRMHAWYVSGKNEIEINTRMLEAKGVSRYNDDTYLVEDLVDGVQIPCLDFAYSFFAKPEKNAVYINGDEKLYLLAGTLKHELTHARQEQIMLSTDNGLENLYLALKKRYPKEYEKISFEKFKSMLPFYVEYKPLKTLDENEKIEFKYPNVVDKNGSAIEISYTPSEIVEYKADYTFDDSQKYYSDLMEIEARAEQAEFYKNYEKYLAGISISVEIINYYFKCLQYICQIMLNKN